MGVVRFKKVNGRVVRKRMNRAKAFLSCNFGISQFLDFFNIYDQMRAIREFRLVEVPQAPPRDDVEDEIESDEDFEIVNDTPEQLVHLLRRLQRTYTDKPTYDEFLLAAAQRIKINVSALIVQRVYNLWPDTGVSRYRRAVKSVNWDQHLFPTKKAHEILIKIMNNVEKAIFVGKEISKATLMEVLVGTAIKVRQGRYDDLDHIFFIGKSGAGKTLLGNLLFSEDNTHRVPTDSVGVGRYNCSGQRRVVKVDDATPEFLAAGENISTLLKMHRANWAAKKHGGTETYRSAIAYITSNVCNLKPHIENSGCSYEAVMRKSLILSTTTQLEYGEEKNYTLTDLGTEKLLLYFLLNNRFRFRTHHGDTIQTMQQFLIKDINEDEHYNTGDDEDHDLSSEEQRYDFESLHPPIHDTRLSEFMESQKANDQRLDDEFELKKLGLKFPIHSTPRARTQTTFTAPPSPVYDLNQNVMPHNFSDWDEKSRREAMYLGAKMYVKAKREAYPDVNFSTIHKTYNPPVTPRNAFLSKTDNLMAPSMEELCNARMRKHIALDVREKEAKRNSRQSSGSSTSGIKRDRKALHHPTPDTASISSGDDFMQPRVSQRIAPKKRNVVEKKSAKENKRDERIAEPSTSGYSRNKSAGRKNHTIPTQIFESSGSDDDLQALSIKKIVPKKVKPIVKKPIIRGETKVAGKMEQTSKKHQMFPTDLLIDSMDEELQRRRNPRSAFFPPLPRRRMSPPLTQPAVFVISSEESDDELITQSQSSIRQYTALGKRNYNVRMKRRDDGVYTPSNPLVPTRDRQMRLDEFMNSAATSPKYNKGTKRKQKSKR